MEYSLTGEGDLDLDAKSRARVISRLIEKLSDSYILTDLAERMVDDIQRRDEAGEYESITTASGLCAALQEHMQAISRDRHLRIRYSPMPEDEPDRDAPERVEERRERYATGEMENFGFFRAERLPGNVGYLDLRVFAAVDMAAETAVATMNFLANTYALIFDLRKNRGGWPDMIALLTTYLFDKPTHLNTMHKRGEDAGTQQYWTSPYVPGKRFGQEKPVYVLTSNFTFSGAEEFAYNLKNLKRAILLGETTLGGAHPVDFVWLDPHFRVIMPVARAVNPISGTNWEGTGVVPDIEVPEAEAYDKAYRMALEHVSSLDLPDLSAQARRMLREEVQGALEGQGI